MTLRVMLDTDTPYKLAIRADILATYADLVDDRQLDGLLDSWPEVVLIDRGMGDLTGKASVYDVEARAGTPAGAPDWYDQQEAKGIKYLTCYANQTTMSQVSAQMGHRAFYRWFATLDGTAHIKGYRPGHTPAAVQCLNAAQLGYHADLSLIIEDGWNPAPNGQAPPWIGKALTSAESTQADLSDLVKILQAHGKVGGQ